MRSIPKRVSLSGFLDWLSDLDLKEAETANAAALLVQRYRRECNAERRRIAREKTIKEHSDG